MQTSLIDMKYEAGEKTLVHGEKKGKKIRTTYRRKREQLMIGEEQEEDPHSQIQEI